MAKGIVANQERRLIKNIYHVSKTIPSGTTSDVDSFGFSFDHTKSVPTNIRTLNFGSSLAMDITVLINLHVDGGVTYSRANATGDLVIEYDIIEFVGVKNVYTGATAITGFTFADDIGATVDNTKSIIFANGRSAENIDRAPYLFYEFDSANPTTKIRFTTDVSDGYNQVRWHVVERY